VSQQWGPSDEESTGDQSDEQFDATRSYDAADVRDDVEADAEADAEQAADTPDVPVADSFGEDAETAGESQDSSLDASGELNDETADAVETDEVEGDAVAEVAETDEAAEVAGTDEEGSSEEALDSGDGVVDEAEEFRKKLRRLPGEWFVIHSYAGYENRVKTNLETRMTSLNMEDYIFQVEVPMEEVVEVKNGTRKNVRRVRIPGYVLVRMDLTDESWGAVRHTPGVTGFVGNTHQPVPLSNDEIFSMLAPTLETTTGTGEKSGSGQASAAPERLVDFEIKILQFKL